MGLVYTLGAVRPHIGDSVDFYVNQFYLILYRDPELKKGIVRYVGDNFAIVTLKDKIIINDIARRNWAYFAYPDSFAYLIATGVRIIPDTAEPDTVWDYYFQSTNGGFYWEQKTAGISDLGKIEIYKILTNPNPPQTAGNWAVIYFATDKGIYSQKQNVPPSGNFGKIALIDKPVYSLTFHPDSVGPIPTDTLEILFAATDSGVYKIRVSKIAVQQKDSLAEAIHLGDLTEKIKAVAVDPVTKEVYAGGDSLWKWDGNTWSVISGIHNVNEIKFFNLTTITVLTEDGLFYSSDGGATWNSTLSGYNLYDIDYGFGYFWVASLGNGVLRASDLGGNWQEINDGFDYLQNFGSLNCRSIYFDSFKNVLLVGNEQGIWKFDTSQDKWINFSRNIRHFMPDEEVQTVKYVIENYMGENLFEKIQNVLRIRDDELWDINADSVVLVILYPLEISGDTSINIAKPLYGYFDDYDLDLTNPDASGKEIFVLNFNYDPSVFYIDPKTGVLDTLILAKYLAYLFGEYACWSVEHEESKPVRTGFAMFALYLAGFNIFDGVGNIGITPGRSFGVSVQRIATPLLDFTRNWMRSPVSRELDRERMAYWFLYVRERFIQAFNDDTSKADSVILEEMLRDKQRDELELFEYYIKEVTGIPFVDMFSCWTIANLLDRPDIENGVYGYQAADSIFDYSNPSSYTTSIPDSAKGPTVIPPRCAMYFTRSDTLSQVYSFDLQDDFGDTIYGFRLYRIIFDSIPQITKISFDTTIEYLIVENDTIQIFKKARNVLKDTLPAGDIGYVVINTSGNDGYFAYSVEKNPPHFDKKYILQNPVITSMLDFYVVVKKTLIGTLLYFDPLLGDAKGSVNPKLILRPFDKTLASMETELEIIEYGDTFVIYNSMLSLGADISGDVLVYSYAQDLVGNTIVLYYDTISVRKIEGAGTYSFLNGRVILEVPENPGFTGKVCASVLPSDYLENNPAVMAYSIGHSAMVFSKPIKIVFKGEKLEENKDLSIYRLDRGNLVRCETYRDGGTLYTYVNSLGIFIIKEGTTNPLPQKWEIRLSSSNLLPMNSLLKFSVALPKEANLSMKIYDITGRKINSLQREKMRAGIHEISLPLKNFLSQGIYFIHCVLESKDKRFERKFKLVIF